MWFSSSAGVSTSLSSMKSTSSACSTSASAKCPMRTLAITGIVTVAMISRITLIEAMRATPPSLRMSEGTRSSAITAHAPAFSAIFACSALVTSMITPPLSISARPTFTRHSFEPLLPLPLPFAFFASISLLLSVPKLFARLTRQRCCPPSLFHFREITTNRALLRARISPAAFRISPSMNRFLPFCSVSRPSTIISCCTLTGFRYSTVNSAVTARTFGHVLSQRFIQCRQPRSVDLAHLGKVLAEKSAPQKLRERGLRELIGVQVGRLLHHAQSFNRRCRSHNPSNAQARKRHLREAVDMNDQIRTVELFQRGDAFLSRVQSRVDVILHYRNLVAPSQLQ